MPASADDWRARQAQDAAARARHLDAQRAAEGAQARVILDEFVAEAIRRGLPTVPLRARSRDGRWTYRTPLRGWYLRRNQTVAATPDGSFYLLVVPAGFAGVLRGVTPEPSDPPLILGKGARDGESIDLADALTRVLAGD